MLDIVERVNISEIVANKIKQLIIDNDLKPGDRLPTEHNLAERFGVSRISLREATKALGFLGILNAKPGRGLIVGEVDMGQVTKFLGFHLAINKYPAHQMIATRTIIETGALSHTMKRMTQDPSIYKNLNHIIKQLGSARSVKKWIDLDKTFHRTLLSSSGLEPLLKFNDLLDIFFEQFRENVKKADWKSGNESHQRIIDALKDGDLGTATSELTYHVESHNPQEDT